ncbi:hypothetical protein P9112_004383 [Eukaryota sp. TZLM1-RC]
MSEEHYKKLQDAALAFFEREKSLFDRAAHLQQELDAVKAQRAEVEATQADQSSQLDSIWKVLEDTRDEQRECEENDKLLQGQIRELEFEKQDLEEQHLKTQKLLAEEIDPQFQHLKRADSSIRQDIARNENVIQTLKNQISELEESLVTLHGDIDKVKESKVTELDKINIEEDLLKQEIKMINELRHEEDQLKNAMTSLDSRVTETDNELKYLQRQLSTLNSSLHSQQSLLNKVCEDEAQKEEKIVDLDGKLVRLDNSLLELQEKKGELEREIEHLVFKKNNLNKEKESLLRSREEMLSRIKNVEDDCGILRNSLSNIEREILTLKKERGNLVKSIKNYEANVYEYQKEIAILIGNVINTDNFTSKELEKVKNIQQSVSQVESDLEQFIEMFKTNDKEIMKLKHQREVSARRATNYLSRLQTTLQNIQANENLITDLSRICKREMAELKDKQKQYDVVKGELNVLRSQVQGQTQNTVELKEKLKILESERSILRNEATTKQTQLTRAENENKLLLNTRDTLTSEANAIANEYFSLEQKLNQHILEIDRLSGIIDRSEQNLLQLRNNYEHMLQVRNNVGLQLIDRNDELCILYEKLNIQEDVIRNGTAESTRKEDEVKLLQTVVVDLTRSLENTRKKVLEIPKLEEEALALHDELTSVKSKSIELSHNLEDPENRDRFRILGGHLETEDQLKAKIDQIEGQIAKKQEELLEADLSLTELTTLSSKVESKISDDRCDSVDIARDASDLRAKLRQLTKKMVATVAELSYYQASALNLQEERREVENTVATAHKNLAQGKPPTEDADELFEKIEKRKSINFDSINSDEEEEFGPPPRPNAYIPSDELGLPKPYGSFGPFMPSQPGSTMRHIRKPEEKPIEI